MSEFPFGRGGMLGLLTQTHDSVYKCMCYAKLCPIVCKLLIL